VAVALADVPDNRKRQARLKGDQARLTAQLNLLRQKQFISTIHQVLNHGMLWE
jgi:hypothetical protein